MSKQRRKSGNKNRGTAVLAVLFLLVGLGVMLFPTFSDLYYRWEASRKIAQYNRALEAQPEDYSELWAAAEAYNRQLASYAADPTATVEAELAEQVRQYLNPLGNGMMGYVDIPKIGVHLPIYQGTQESALQAGAGYWLGTSLPTGGASTHCVLTAHNGLVKAKMFTDIDQLEEGDTFTLTVLDRVLTYEVDQILTTLPDELEPLRIVEGQDYVTLYTCTPYGINTHRLLVRGHRIPTPETGSTQQGTIIETVESCAWLLFPALLALILILLAAVIRRLVRRKKIGRRNSPSKKEDCTNEAEN